MPSLLSRADSSDDESESGSDWIVENNVRWKVETHHNDSIPRDALDDVWDEARPAQRATLSFRQNTSYGIQLVSIPQVLWKNVSFRMDHVFLTFNRTTLMYGNIKHQIFSKHTTLHASIDFCLALLEL